MSTAIDNHTLVQRLISEFGYPEDGAQMIAGDLASLCEPLDAAFQEWWKSGAFPPIEVDGYTLDRLVRERGMTPVAAFLALDWLSREPARAKRVLRKGGDFVR